MADVVVMFDVALAWDDDVLVVLVVVAFELDSSDDELPWFVQIRTKKRVCAHVHRTLAPLSVEPPFSSSDPSPVFMSEELTSAGDRRKIERSK